MPALSALSRAKKTELSAIVIRADGSREDLGVIGYWHRNPLFRALFKIRRQIRRSCGF